MGDLANVSEAVHLFGDSAIALGKRAMEVGTVDQAAVIAAAIPIYGLIGQEFVASLATAQANHLSAVADLAAVYAAIGSAAHEDATHQETTGHKKPDTFTAIGRT